MGNNEVKVTGKNKLPKVKRISYTPQTLAAAIAKNIRAEKERRDLPLDWMQRYWGEVKKSDLIASDIKIERAYQLSNIQSVYDLLKDELNTGYLYRDNYVAVSCGTTGCIAGWATALSGDVPVVQDSWVQELKDRAEYDNDEAGDVTQINQVYSPELKAVVGVSARGQQLLGLNDQEASYCFSGDRTESEVLSYLDTLATGGKVIDSPAFIHKDRHFDNYYGHFKPEDGCPFCEEYQAILDWLDAESDWILDWLDAERNWGNEYRAWLRAEKRYIEDWLYAEKDYIYNVKTWLRAEKLWKEHVIAWLAVEDYYLNLGIETLGGDVW